jgi:hypothetical protein
LRRRASAGQQKSTLAREFGISQETLYQYSKVAAGALPGFSPTPPQARDKVLKILLCNKINNKLSIDLSTYPGGNSAGF